ncbi:MAG: TRAP transporter large permease subunit, partial [Deltaproteobacteria bacterium]|nr:TRAP transporter large permease subunit [Deltaproteobacteria bacterium]
MIIALVLVVLALLGAPLFAIIVSAALLGFRAEEVDLQVVTIEIYRLAEMPILLAIPLFTFAGYLLGESNAPHRLVRLTNALLDWLDGGLAIVALAACALFTAFTGASGVTIVALGALLYPALRESGYPDRFSLGLVTTAGSLGLLFAPALPLILYGVVAQQMDVEPPVRIEDLFAAGLLPGLMMVVLLSAYAMWKVRGRTKSRTAFSWREAFGAIREAGWEIPLPIVVLGGIYSGAFAISEAAAVTAIYVLIVEVGIRREIPITKLPGVMRESMVLVGAIMIILGVSLASTNYLIDTEVPARLFDLVRAQIDSRFVFLILLNIFLLGLGMILDIFSAIV